MMAAWLAVSVALFSVVSGDRLNALQVRWGNPSNGYFDMPWSLSEVVSGGSWHRAGYDPELKVDLVSHFRDPRFFLLFDQKGTIAGVRFGFHKQDVNRLSLHDSRHRYTFPRKMFKSTRIWGKKIWYTSVLFAPPDVLKRGGRAHLDVISSLYYWADSAWHHVTPSECDVTEDLQEQGCYNGMGKHYYYKTNQNTSCAEWQGFFTTYDQGVLSGFGVTVFGSFVSNYFTPNYYEYPAFPVVKTVLQTRPACVDDWLPNTGVTSVHVFLSSDAADIFCPQQDWSSQHCLPPDAQIIVV